MSVVLSLSLKSKEIINSVRRVLQSQRLDVPRSRQSDLSSGAALVGTATAPTYTTCTKTLCSLDMTVVTISE